MRQWVRSTQANQRAVPNFMDGAPRRGFEAERYEDGKEGKRRDGRKEAVRVRSMWLDPTNCRGLFCRCSGEKPVATRTASTKQRECAERHISVALGRGLGRGSGSFTPTRKRVIWPAPTMQRSMGSRSRQMAGPHRREGGKEGTMKWWKLRAEGRTEEGRNSEEGRNTTQRHVSRDSKTGR